MVSESFELVNECSDVVMVDGLVVIDGEWVFGFGTLISSQSGA